MISSIKQQYLLGLSIVIAFLLPHSNTFLLLMNPLLCLLLVFISRERVRTSIVWVPIIPILLSILINISYAHTKAYYSTATIMLYFYMFPMVGKINMKNSYLYFILVAVMLSQIVYLFHISFFENFFNTYYPMSEEDLREAEHMSYDNIWGYRLGGLFHNSNQCSKYLTMLMAFYLIINKNEHLTKLIPFLLFAFISILLTGSRTGFITATSIIFFAYLRQNRISFNKKMIIGLLSIIGFGVVASKTIGTFRGFEIEAGLDNSINYKAGALLYYLNYETSAIHLLLGHLDVSLFERVYGISEFGFDSEYGSLIYRFGFLGIISIFVFWFLILKRLDNYSKIIFLNMLWIISSTIVCSFRAFFIFMLLLSVIYSNNQNTNKYIK